MISDFYNHCKDANLLKSCAGINNKIPKYFCIFLDYFVLFPLHFICFLSLFERTVPIYSTYVAL